MENVAVWGDFLQGEKVQYLLAAAVLVFSKLLGAPVIISLLLAGVGLVLGVVQLPGAGEAFQSYLSGWWLAGMLALVAGMALFKILAGRGQGVFLLLFLVLGTLSAINFFEPNYIPALVGNQVAALSLNAFACLALCGAVIMAFRSATTAVFAVLWVCVAVGFNGEGILRVLPSSWFNGQLRALVMSEQGVGDELPRFALKLSDIGPQAPSSLVAIVSRDHTSGDLMRAQLLNQSGAQVFVARGLEDVPSEVRHVVVDLDSIVSVPSARCQPSALAALVGINPVCREDMRGPGVVCVSATINAEKLATLAPGVSCDNIVSSVAALSFS